MVQLAYRRLANGEYFQITAEPLGETCMVYFGHVDPDDATRILWLWEEPLSMTELALLTGDLVAAQVALCAAAAGHVDVLEAGLADARERVQEAVTARRAAELLAASLAPPEPLRLDSVHVEPGVA